MRAGRPLYCGNRFLPLGVVAEGVPSMEAGSGYLVERLTFVLFICLLFSLYLFSHCTSRLNWMMNTSYRGHGLKK